MHVFQHELMDVRNPSNNIQNSDLFLELRGGHVVVFRVNVLQAKLVTQLVDNVSECFTFFLLPKKEISLARSSCLTSHVPTQQLDPAILVVPFSFVAVRPEKVSDVSKEPKVQEFRHQRFDHVLLRAVPFFVRRTKDLSSLSSSSCMSRVRLFSL